jgi:hypothetical protein
MTEPFFLCDQCLPQILLNSYYRFMQYILTGRAMDQTFSRQPLTPEARVYVRVIPYGICGDRSGNGTGFSPDFFGFPLSL